MNGEKVIAWLIFVLIGLTLGLLVWAIFEGIQHDRFLEAYGCELLMTAPTGRHHWVGKLYETENVYVYECKDGTRTEVH